MRYILIGLLFFYGGEECTPSCSLGLNITLFITLSQPELIQRHTLYVLFMCNQSSNAIKK